MVNWKGLLLIAVLIVIIDNHGCHAEPTAPIVSGTWNLVHGSWTVPTKSKQFFLEGKEPAGLTGDAFIEQIYGAGPNPYYATMYNITQRSPVYSAYRVRPADAKKLGTHSRPNNKFREFRGDPGHNKIYRANTAAGITRGHLNPSYINSYNRDAMKSTFTYSNAVPQWKDSNNGVWRKFERKVVDYAKYKCRKNDRTLYLLTGPADFEFDGNKKVPTTPQYIKDRTGRQLPVPPVLWTAGCCWKGPGSAAEGLGVIGQNKQAGSVAYDVGLTKLQQLLGGAPLFPGDKNRACEINKASAGP